MNDILVDSRVMPVPQHLKSCTQPIGCECTPTQYAGSLRCACGCESFEILNARDVIKHGAIVAAKCSECATTYVLVDGEQKLLNPRTKLKAHSCRRCNGIHHHPEVTVEETEGSLEASGWKRGVRTTTIDLTCTDCGCSSEAWVKTETHF
ncbi:MAG TPA: hypothetical protein VEJ63_01540 [Planctomycetota bacterium]|nr:hypothetical protein [Planctomycetota bacterium]